MKKYYANGKLLLIGEYIILDGAKGLALPTKYGQTLMVEKLSGSSNILHWLAKKNDSSIWFEAKFDLKSMNITHASNPKLALTLQKILLKAKQLKPIFFESNCSYFCTTELGFPQEWGLGSSSTLINLISQWINIDQYELNDSTFKTSGYDIACANSSNPIIFSRHPIQIKNIIIEWDFTEDLYFVYLNKKQNTQVAVSSHYKEKTKSKETINYLSNLVEKILKVNKLNDFESIMDEYQDILSKIIQQPIVKKKYFSDYEGCVKSLGTWGGDFVLVTRREGFENYFRNKGYNIIIPFKDMLLI